MRIGVYGTGGVGGYFGGQLAKAGMDVIFMARGEHLRAIQESGLEVESVKGNFKVYPAQAESDPAAVGHVDVVMVGVKAWQVKEVAQAMRPLIGDRTVIIPLQNGVEAADQLREVFGSEHVAGGLCRISSLVAAPGHIQHVGVEPFIAFNWFDNHSDPRLDTLRNLYLSQGVQAEIPVDINVALWLKFMFIASISGVGAVTRVPVGIQRSIPETRRMLESAINEVAAVGRARGVALTEQVEQDTIHYIDSIPPMTTASMARDIISGKPSELEYQTGSVVRLGRAAGILTPVNDFIYASLLPSEANARGK